MPIFRNLHPFEEGKEGGDADTDSEAMVEDSVG